MSHVLTGKVAVKGALSKTFANVFLNVQAFNPPYPRLFLRQAFANMNVLDVTGSLANFQTAAGHIAKFHAGMFTGTRGTTWGAGAYNLSNIIDYVKSRAEYAGQSAYTKYTNVTQIGSPTGDTSATGTFLRNKAKSESCGNRNWVMTKPPTFAESTGSDNANKWNMNFTSFVNPDSENGFKWSKWYPYFWCCPYNLSGSPDYKIGTGHGIGEGKWDGVFCDDQSMITGQGSEVNGCDMDGDGVAGVSGSGADSMNDADVQTARSQGYVDTANAWKQSLFPNATMHPKQTMKYFLGNITAIALKTDLWPLNMRSIYHGGLIEEVSGKSKAQGFGSYTVNDDANHAHSGMMGVYWRGMENCIAPKIVAWGHETGNSGVPVTDDFYGEFRAKWGTRPAGAYPKDDNYITESGGAYDGTKKYPGETADFSDWRVVRWALACCLMDDGYFSCNQKTSTWNTGIPWFDEYVGGDDLEQAGWLGYPVSGATGAAQRAAYEDGVWRREFDNGIVIMNPPRGTPDTNQGQTVTVPSPGAGYRWKRLVAKPGGYTTDGNSGTQDDTVNNGDWQGAAGASSSLVIREFDALFLRRVTV